MSSIIVVEGIHDEMRIKSIYPQAQVLTTNGREIDPNTLSLVKKLSEDHSIIVLTDPDGPGEKIRSVLSQTVPSCQHAFIRKKDCISKNKKKVGIEHAKKETIEAALSQLLAPQEQAVFTIFDLYDLGLNGSKDSKRRRDRLSDLLNIGRPNAKTFLKRLNMLKISKEKLEEMVCTITDEQ